MEKSYTIGIYGIQDINNSNTPTLSHDHAIAVMHKGKVVYHAQLERLNREKHSDAMPEMLYDLLKEKHMLKLEANLVFVDNILGRSFINKQGNIRFEAPLNNTLKNNFETGRSWWLNHSREAFVLNHELAHIGSCLPFYGAFEENSLLIHFDGGASQSNFSAWHYQNNQLKKLEASWKFKKLSALFNANALTFGMVQAKMQDLNSVPGKFMGFASYGKYRPELESWLEENHYFENAWKSKKAFFDSAKQQFNIELTQLDQKHPFIQDVAATIHQVFVRESFEHIQQLQKTTKAKFLYYSGGSALNIVLNTQLVNAKLFEQVYIPPCCNDSGLALGAAAFFEWANGQKIEISSPYLNNWGIEDYQTHHSQKTIEETAQLLLHEKVIGICNNQAEIGPRALGNRSILSLASSKKLAQKVSMVHKKREWYRPVAPIMLEKNAKYFTGKQTIDALSKYMLLDFSIDKKHTKELEGAVHVDDTSRIQTLFNREENPFIWDLLTYLDNKHQVKALINTSFNYRGEPIVHTKHDAKKSARLMQLDAVIFNGSLELLS